MPSLPPFESVTTTGTFRMNMLSRFEKVFMEGSIVYLGGTGITADPGKNSYDPLFNRHFEYCQHSYNPPPNISSRYDTIACKYYK